MVHDTFSRNEQFSNMRKNSFAKKKKKHWKRLKKDRKVAVAKKNERKIISIRMFVYVNLDSI